MVWGIFWRRKSASFDKLGDEEVGQNEDLWKDSHSLVLRSSSSSSVHPPSSLLLFLPFPLSLPLLCGGDTDGDSDVDDGDTSDWSGCGGVELISFSFIMEKSEDEGEEMADVWWTFKKSIFRERQFGEAAERVGEGEAEAEDRVHHWVSLSNSFFFLVVELEEEEKVVEEDEEEDQEYKK